MANRTLIDEAHYCPPLDTSLYRAITSEYDLEDPTKVAEVRGLLDGLKEDAELEQQTAFDPSGSSNPLDETSNPETSGHRGGAASEELISLSEDTGVTSITGSVKSLNLANEDSGSASTDFDDGIEDLSTTEKEDLLAQINPEIKKIHIVLTLKKNGGNFQRTLDELLNQLWLKENEPTVHKSVDAFFDDGVTLRGRGNKGRKRAKKKPLQPSSSQYSTSHPTSSSSNSTSPEPNRDGLAGPPPGTPQPSVWSTKANEITFLAERIPNIPRDTLASIYHRCHASLHETLATL
ncbi:MAG: hypothetical protein LQ340_005860, partial [Diploschistes diacapsis]